RLQNSVVDVPAFNYHATEQYGYDTLGNLTQKGPSTYTYGAPCLAGSRAAGPHAVCTSGGGAARTYDANGNMTSDANRSVSYNPANMVVHLQSTAPSQSGTVDLMYGADGNRVVQVATSGGTTSRTVYVGLGPTGK